MVIRLPSRRVAAARHPRRTSRSTPRDSLSVAVFSGRCHLPRHDSGDQARCVARRPASRHQLRKKPQTEALTTQHDQQNSQHRHRPVNHSTAMYEQTTTPAHATAAPIAAKMFAGRVSNLVSEATFRRSTMTLK